MTSSYAASTLKDSVLTFPGKCLYISTAGPRSSALTAPIQAMLLRLFKLSASVSIVMFIPASKFVRTAKSGSHRCFFLFHLRHSSHRSSSRLFGANADEASPAHRGVETEDRS